MDSCGDQLPGIDAAAAKGHVDDSIGRVELCRRPVGSWCAAIADAPDEAKVQGVDVPQPGLKPSLIRVRAVG